MPPVMVMVCSIIFIGGCKIEVSDKNKNQDISDVDFNEMHGIWERKGYGDIIQIRREHATVYQYTRASCFQAEKYTQQQFNHLFTNIIIDDEKSSFSTTYSEEPAFRRHYVSSATLPEVCDSHRLITKFEPTRIFDHVWHTFNDYYAFFKERNIDWDSQYKAVRPRVNDEMSKRAFFSVLRKLLSPIDDGHIRLESDAEEYFPENTRGRELILKAGFDQQTGIAKYHAYVSSQMSRYREILLSYLDQDSIKYRGGPDNDIFMWGTIKQRIGYLHIEYMTGISIKNNHTSIDDVNATNSIMENVINDLHDTDAIIIDLRFNDGGDDAVSLAIASYFADAKQLVITKTTRSFLGETPLRELYLTPNLHNSYLKPVVVITGPDSASATEIFIMAMRALPQVTQLGESTNGILSDELYKYLPKGWEFSLSNEVYFDHLGENHEVTGIPPHIEVNVFSLEDINKGRNSALEAAITKLMKE